MLYPVLKNFSYAPGVTFDYRFQYAQGSPGSQLPTDLSGWSATLNIGSHSTIYKTLRSGATAGTSGIFFGGDQNNLTNGIIDILITSADTAAATWRYAKYALLMTRPGGTTFGMLYGSFTRLGFLPGT